MTPRHATRDTLLQYLACEERARIVIYRYMFSLGVSVPATREQLRRLCAAGAVEQSDGRYRVIARPSAASPV